MACFLRSFASLCVAAAVASPFVISYLWFWDSEFLHIIAKVALTIVLAAITYLVEFLIFLGVHSLYEEDFFTFSLVKDWANWVTTNDLADKFIEKV